MRLALATALLIVCLCSQGCLSFFALGSTHTSKGRSRKTTCIVTGILSTTLMVSGMALMSYGMEKARARAEEEDRLDQSISSVEELAGIPLVIGGIILGIVSISQGIQSGRDSRVDGYRRYGPSPHQPRGHSTVGLPCLKHIDPRKLPIQRVNWYWIQEE